MNHNQAVGIIAAVAVLFVAVSGARSATPVSGTVSLPEVLKRGRHHNGYWRLENGILPILPEAWQSQTVVVLAGFSAKAPQPETVAVKVSGLQARPAVVVVGQGSVLEIHNLDRVSHYVSTPAHPLVMPLERLAPGSVSRRKFNEVGGYVVRSREHPHIVISVVVSTSPHFAFVGQDGAFEILDASTGEGTVRVWSHGRWVHQEPLTVGTKPMVVPIKVSPPVGTER
jgi:hypothetical protein